MYYRNQPGGISILYPYSFPTILMGVVSGGVILNYPNALPKSGIMEYLVIH